MNKQNISGIHHITAICGQAAENLAFYENILGLRLVKQTVNFDDPATYHLYYGDDRGTPGTILTFFPWQDLPRGENGAGMVTAVAFSVPRGSIDFWGKRLGAAGMAIGISERFGEAVIGFTDPHGLRLELIEVARPLPSLARNFPAIPKAYAITGFHSATATLTTLEAIAPLLREVMGMNSAGQEGNRYRFAMADAEAAGRLYDVVVDPQAPTGRTGVGSVHHIAFRAEDDATQLNWQKLLREARLGVTEVRDRQYFRSIYFHSPGGVLFEIATEGPGFAVDESPAELGKSLRLPPQFEAFRAKIERQLPSLRVEFRHVFTGPEGTDDGSTIVALHGTGGNEHDLLELAAAVKPEAAILGIRGKVLENGQSRFFRRLSTNVFDEKDIVARVRELADFLAAAAHRYGRDGGRLTALGYSNGANMAAAMFLLRPEIFASAILIRPMLPLQDPSLPELRGKRILVLRGSHDRMIPARSTDQLVEILQQAGAELTVRTMAAGHEITGQDLAAIREWRGMV